MEKTLGIVFPGYGEQYIGMAKALHDEHRLVQEYFEQAAQCTEINFVKLMFASSSDEISSPRYAFLAIFLYEYALYALLQQQGLIKPDFIAGHGIGEYAAACASGSLSFVDALYILNKYAQLYSEFLKGESYSVLRLDRGFTPAELQKICKEFSDDQDQAYISARNTEQGFYVSGSEVALDRIVEYCREQKIRKVKDIGAAHNLHSAAVDQLVKELNIYFYKIDFKALQVPVITCVDGVYVTTAESLQASMMRRVNNPILWYDVMEGLAGCDVIISVGPGGQLIDWIKTMYPEKECYVVQSFSDVAAIREYLIAPEVVAEDGSADLESADEPVEAPREKSLFEADQVNEKSSDYDVED
jgi:[acyl-carrier-protein] S-malonyltransferase